MKKSPYIGHSCIPPCMRTWHGHPARGSWAGRPCHAAFCRSLAVLFLLAGAALLHAADPAPAETAADLITAAQRLARDRNSDPAAVSNAFVKALSAADATAENRARVLLDLGQFYLGRNQAAAGHHFLEEAASAAGAPAGLRVQALRARADARFRDNFKGAFASYFTKGIDDAAELHRRIIALPDVSNGDKIAAYRDLANCLLEKMDIAGANDALKKAAALPGLTDEERRTAIGNQANALYRQQEYGQALPLYESLWRADLDNRPRQEIEGRIIAITRRLKGEDAAIALMRDKFPADPMRLANACRDYGRTGEALKLYDAILADEAAREKPNTRWQADVLRTVINMMGDKSWPEFRKVVEPRLAKYPDLDADMTRHMHNHPFVRSAVAGNADFIKWRGERQARHDAAAAALPGARPAVPDGKQMESLIRARDAAAALAQCKELLSNTNTPPALRMSATLNRIVIETRDRAAEAVRQVNAALNADALLKTGRVQRAEALLASARSAMSLEFFATARALHAERDKMLVPSDRPSLACPFVARAPKTVAEFRDSAHFRNDKNRARVDRKYGDNLQFLLETDANITGRQVTDGDGSLKSTEFTALCDDEGVAIFLFAPTDKARAIEAGFEGLGGYEIYLTAGPEDPYDCFLIDMPPDGGTTIFNTQYNNAGYRQLDPHKGNVSVTHRFYDDGIATLIRVSWKAYFNRLPSDGTVWDFEVCHWDKGGRTWGGSKSVHHRSSFGALVFANLTPANRLAIQRRLLPAAARVYRNALSSRNGYMEIWQDPELGDQEFFLAVIEPLQTRLSSYLPRVRADMSDADVAEVFDNAAIEWMNIDYIVARLRRDYLDARRTGGR